MIAVLALALGPLAMPAEMAMAAAPQMSAMDHCDEQPQPEPARHDQTGKSCCVGCIAVAGLAGPMLDGAVLHGSRERPGPDRFRLGYLGEIATPPPRSA